jgi:hypothetical protein
VQGASIRADIDQALAEMDPEGRGSLTGMSVPRAVRKGLEKLPELIPDERVIALAAGKDPSIPGASLSDIAQNTKSIRLLVVTEANLWEVQAAGRLNGSRPKGIRTELVDISDVRVLSERKLNRLGSKERIMAFDHLRGAQVATLSIEIFGSDETLERFASVLAGRARQINEALAIAERPPLGSQLSVADELTKLLDLRQRGVLDDAEFEAQKNKLLNS